MITTQVEKKILIVFDDMIAGVKGNKKFQLQIEELFIRFKRLNIALVFIIQSYFTVPEDIRLNLFRMGFLYITK